MTPRQTVAVARYPVKGTMLPLSNSLDESFAPGKGTCEEQEGGEGGETERARERSETRKDSAAFEVQIAIQKSRQPWTRTSKPHINRVARRSDPGPIPACGPWPRAFEGMRSLRAVCRCRTDNQASTAAFSGDGSPRNSQLSPPLSLSQVATLAPHHVSGLPLGRPT